MKIKIISDSTCDLPAQLIAEHDITLTPLTVVKGDEQFEIDDNRSFDTMYKDMSGEGLQPVLNDYVYV